jgi:hypothetical protein
MDAAEPRRSRSVGGAEGYDTLGAGALGAGSAANLTKGGEGCSGPSRSRSTRAAAPLSSSSTIRPRLKALWKSCEMGER